MTRLILSEEARQDLQDIGDYIAYNNPAAAVSFIARLEQRCSEIVQFPGIGTSRDKLHPELKSLAEGRYLIFFRYKTITNTVEIVRIVHAYRKTEKIFRPL